MDMEHLCHVHTWTPQLTQEIYLLSTGELPTPIILIINEKVGDGANITAFESQITEDIVDSWRGDPSNRKVIDTKITRNLVLQEVKNALIGEKDGFEYDVFFKLRTPQTLLLTNNVDPKHRMILVEVPLYSISPFEGMKYLSSVGKACRNMLKKNEDETSKILKLEKEKKRLEDLLKSLTVDRNHMEDRTLRAFTHVLNTKKRMIQKLKGTKPKKKKPRGRKISSSEDDTQEFTTYNSDDYDQETQVDEYVSPAAAVAKKQAQRKTGNGSDTDFEEENESLQVQISPKPRHKPITAGSSKTVGREDQRSQSHIQNVVTTQMEITNAIKEDGSETGDDLDLDDFNF